MLLLKIAYALNILILGPVVFAMLASQQSAQSIFETKASFTDDQRLMIGSFWMGILLASGYGLVQPTHMVGVLIFQVIYKVIFLGLFALPAMMRGGMRAVPVGLTAAFLMIVILWPILLYRSLPEWR